MKSFTTADFWKAYAAISLDMRKKAQRAYQLWQNNPVHSSLHFKKVGKNLWSVRVSGGLKKSDHYYWFWIGALMDMIISLIEDLCPQSKV
jgi:hypothetical protein